MATDRQRQILDVIRALAEGEVTTYGDVADSAGHPRQARLVGRILAEATVELPWWRVVDATGCLRAGDTDLQRSLLSAEGVVVRDGRVRDAPVGRFARIERGVSRGRPNP